MANCSSKDSGYVDNWQAGKTVTECNLHMLTTEDCSDDIFRVGSEKHVIRAHRYVLVSRSCVFYAMFCGPLAEKGEITIPDIEVDVFSEFLRFVYADTVNITPESVIGLLYTSRKYAVDALFNQCVAFLEKSLSEDNVCQILKQCHGYGELDLEQKALKILTEAGEKVIKSPGFLDLCSGCFKKFLKSEELSLKEEDIFEATLSWAKQQCQKDNISQTPENLRNVLGDMIYEIQFSSLSQDYLVHVVGPTRILTGEERVSIMDKTVDPEVDITPFKSVQRKRSSVQDHKSVCRFKGITSCTWSSSTRTDAIAFSCNKSIQLLGCQLYPTRLDDGRSHKLNITVYDDQDKIITASAPNLEHEMVMKDLKNVNNVFFPDPVSLVADRFYTICTITDVDYTQYGNEGQSSVNTDGVEFTFWDSSKSSPGCTTFNRGQIPGLLWK